MDEQSNLRNFVEEITSFGEEGPAPAKQVSPALDLPPIGLVAEIAGSGSRIQMDGATLAQLADHSDPSVAMSGQVGSQVKMLVANSWLIANVRTMRSGEPGAILPIRFSSVYQAA
jgi:hypothetical protein